MATLLQFVGLSTIDLNGSNIRLMDYTPVAPSLPPDELLALLLSNKAAEMTVAESAVVLITGESVAALKATINSIEYFLALMSAYRQLIGVGPRVYVKYRPDELTTIYRSEISGGRVDYDKKALKRSFWSGARTIKVTIAWERQIFWEADTETELALTNSNGSNVTGGLTVYDHDDADAGHDNYVEIAAAQVADILPAPPRIEIGHLYAGNAGRRFYIGHKAQGAPTNFVHMLEAESATLGGAGATSAGDAACSNGNKVNFTNVPATATTLLTWTISGGQASYIISQWIRFFPRFSTLPSNATCQLRLTLQDSTTGAVIGRTDWTTLNTADSLQQLGTLILSPNLQGQATPGALKLVLEGKDSQAACDFSLDFMALMPIEAGQGFRYLKPIDEALVSVPVSTGVIVDNLIDNVLYMESFQDVYAGFGGPIMLFPGVVNRLYFLHDGADGLAPIDRTLLVRGFIRKRVLTI